MVLAIWSTKSLVKRNCWSKKKSKAYITNLSLIACQEPFKKFVVVGGGWSRPILVLSLDLKLNNSSDIKVKVTIDWLLIVISYLALF